MSRDHGENIRRCATPIFASPVKQRTSIDNRIVKALAWRKVAARKQVVNGKRRSANIKAVASRAEQVRNTAN